MAIGNLGAVMNVLEGFISHEFLTPSNQGISLLPEMVRQIASRADLVETNLRVTVPRFFDGTNDVDVEAGAVKLIAVVGQSQAAQVEDAAILLYNSNTVTEGTTDPHLRLIVPATNTAATATLRVFVFPEPVPFAALSWSVLDHANYPTDTQVGDANGVKVMLVYAE